MSIENIFISYKLSLLAKAKGFSELCFTCYDINTRELIYKVSNHIASCRNGEIGIIGSNITAPTHQQIIDWFRNEKQIDITIMPVFREKCGYDSFKRDGYTFTILRIDPCQFLSWNDFNQCAEDRDEENKDADENKVLTPSFKNYYECLNEAIEKSFELI